MNREAIYAALFAKLSVVGSFNTKSRKWRTWNDVAAADQPALFLIQRGEVAETVRGTPTRWSLKVDVCIYVNSAGSPVVPPSQLLNPLLDAIEAAIAPDINGVQTLGGLVSHCWIEGQIETDEGVLGDQAVAIIPIEMYTTAGGA